MEASKRSLRILFVGNSHTYVHDMPAMVARRAREAGYACEVTMIAHGGWMLEQHVKEPDVRFNILFGHYDYVVLQEHTHPFAPEEKYLTAVKDIVTWVREAGSTPVIYATWAQKTEPEKQPAMNELQGRAARENGALLANVGAGWLTRQAEIPDTDMFYMDGQHASVTGSEYAAQVIWETVAADLNKDC